MLIHVFFPKTGAASLEECVLPRHWCPRVCLGGSMGVKEKSWGDAVNFYGDILR